MIPQTRPTLKLFCAAAALMIGGAPALRAQPLPVAFPAPEVRERQADATLVATYPLDGPAPSGERVSSGVFYANLTSGPGGSFINGGAAGTGAAAITRLIADDISMTGGGIVATCRFAVANAGPAQVTARMRLRFYQADGPGGAPGTIITALNFNPISIAPGASVFQFGFTPVITLPQNFWAGITFDAGGAGAPTATIAQLNQLGMARFAPPTSGTSTQNVFQTTAAGSFAGSNPSGSILGGVGSLGWEFDAPTGACCYLGQPCNVTYEIECLAGGGAYRGDNTVCAAACNVVDPFLQPPPIGSYFVLDQITPMDFQSNTLQARQSQQFQPPPLADPQNIAYVDEFTITKVTVIQRVDAVVLASGGGELPPPNGFLWSLWPTQSAAVADSTFQGNTVYNQGYTVQGPFRGGGEYDLYFNVGANPYNWAGVAVKVDPTIAYRSDERTSSAGLVLNPGTYTFAITLRGTSAWGHGSVIDSNHQDPRFPPNNAAHVNPSGAIIPGLIQQTGTPAAYRIVGRGCIGDFNGDGAVTTQDLTIMLSVFGATVSPGRGPDINGDAVVNLNDLVIFLPRFGQPCQ